MPSNKNYQIPSSGTSDHTSGIPSVAMIVHPSPFPSIPPTTFTLDVPGEKPSDKPSIHPLQAPIGLSILFPSIQASDFPNHDTSVYSSSRPIYGPSRLKILHTILNQCITLS